jgi:multiple sugar transport system permease protein
VWPYLMAASTLIVAPMIITFFLTQRTFVEGITLTGVKG